MVRTGGGGGDSAADARSAAIFGPASCASDDQPALSRTSMQTSRSSAPSSAACSVKSGAWTLQDTVTGAPASRLALKRSISRPHNSTAVSRRPPQAGAMASASRGTVPSQEQANTTRSDKGRASQSGGTRGRHGPSRSRIRALYSNRSKERTRPVGAGKPGAPGWFSRHDGLARAGQGAQARASTRLHRSRLTSGFGRGLRASLPDCPDG